MNKKVAIIISPNWRSYAKKFLPDLVTSLKKQDYEGEMKFFITDNETSKESFEYLRSELPDAAIMLNKENEGFAKGNNDPMRLAITKGFDYIFLINMDTIAEPDCVRKLVEVFETDKENLTQAFSKEKNTPDPSPTKGGQARGELKRIGAVQPLILLHPDKEKVNSLGCATHFLGFGYCEGYGELLSLRAERSNLEIEKKEYEIATTATNRDLAMTHKNIFYPSGAAVMFRADVLKEIGLFDEEMWMYNEDQDLGWRTWLAGFRCVFCPESIIYHKYEFSRSITKYYWMDRNRIIVMLKNYKLGTILLVFPAFLVMEFGLIIFSFKSGWWKEKKQVWKYFFSLKNWQYIFRTRRESQGLRKVKDRDIIPMISGKIWYQEIDDPKLRMINPVFNAYWWLIRKIIFW